MVFALKCLVAAILLVTLLFIPSEYLKNSGKLESSARGTLNYFLLNFFCALMVFLVVLLDLVNSSPPGVPWLVSPLPFGTKLSIVSGGIWIAAIEAFVAGYLFLNIGNGLLLLSGGGFYCRVARELDAARKRSGEYSVFTAFLSYLLLFFVAAQFFLSSVAEDALWVWMFFGLGLFVGAGLLWTESKVCR